MTASVKRLFSRMTIGMAGSEPAVFARISRFIKKRMYRYGRLRYSYPLENSRNRPMTSKFSRTCPEEGTRAYATINKLSARLHRIVYRIAG